MNSHENNAFTHSLSWKVFGKCLKYLKILQKTIRRDRLGTANKELVAHALVDKETTIQIKCTKKKREKQPKLHATMHKKNLKKKSSRVMSAAMLLKDVCCLTFLLPPSPPLNLDLVFGATISLSFALKVIFHSLSFPFCLFSWFFRFFFLFCALAFQFRFLLLSASLNYNFVAIVLLSPLCRVSVESIGAIVARDPFAQCATIAMKIWYLDRLSRILFLLVFMTFS